MPSDEPIPAIESPRLSSVRSVGARLGWIGLVVGLLCLLAGMLGRYFWAFDLLSHFRAQYAMLFGVCLLVLIVCRAWRGVLLALALCVFCGATSASWYGFRHTPVGAEGSIQLVHANVLVGNPNTRTMLADLTSTAPDIIGMQEVNGAWLREIERLEGYTVVASDAREDSFGIVLLVRTLSDVEISDVEVLTPGEPHTLVPAISATVTAHGRAFRMLYLHTLPPIGASGTAVRDAMLDFTMRWAATQDDPVVVLGDLNATEWSTPYRSLVDETGLLNASHDFVTGGTWPAALPWPMRLRIDHCLHDPTLGVIDFQFLEAHASDHLPIRCTLAWD